MAGLNCGVPSGLGWPILKSTAFAFMSCVDEITKSGMKLYYYPMDGKILLYSVSERPMAGQKRTTQL